MPEDGDRRKCRACTCIVVLVVIGAVMGVVFGVLGVGKSSSSAADATLAPSAAPTVSHTPTAAPSAAPTLSPTTLAPTRTPTVAPTLSPAGASISSTTPSQPVGAIAGGVVGAAVILVILAIFVAVRRRRRSARRGGGGYSEQHDGEESVSLEPGRGNDDNDGGAVVTGFKGTRQHTEADDLENAPPPLPPLPPPRKNPDRVGHSGGGGGEDEDEDEDADENGFGAYGNDGGYADEQDAAGSVVLRAPAGAQRAKHVQRALAILSQTSILAAINQAARQTQRSKRALRQRGNGDTADLDAGYETDTSRAQSEMRVPVRTRPSRRFGAVRGARTVKDPRNAMARASYEAVAAYTDDDAASSVSSASRPRSVASVGTRPRVAPIRVPNPRSASMPLASAAAAYSVLGADGDRDRIDVDDYGLPVLRGQPVRIGASASQPPSPPHDPPHPHLLPPLPPLPPRPQHLLPLPPVRDEAARAPSSVYDNPVRGDGAARESDRDSQDEQDSGN